LVLRGLVGGRGGPCGRLVARLAAVLTHNSVPMPYRGFRSRRQTWYWPGPGRRQWLRHKLFGLAAGDPAWQRKVNRRIGAAVAACLPGCPQRLDDLAHLGGVWRYSTRMTPHLGLLPGRFGCCLAQSRHRLGTFRSELAQGSAILVRLVQRADHRAEDWRESPRFLVILDQLAGMTLGAGDHIACARHFW
jgi:hypothetical protein